MTKILPRMTPETVVLTVLLVMSVLSLFFIDKMVAAPKLLFGRSLSAMQPSLFPEIVLSILALLCAAALIQVLRRDPTKAEAGPSSLEWQRGIAFFAIMVLFALTMEPFGFLLSSALTMTLCTILMGNRSPVVILLLAFVAPIGLYLGATRLLVVSLPELNAIELIYARILGS